MQDSLSINLAISQRDEDKFTESSMNKIGFILKEKSKIEKITDQQFISKQFKGENLNQQIKDNYLKVYKQRYLNNNDDRPQNNYLDLASEGVSALINAYSTSYDIQDLSSDEQFQASIYRRNKDPGDLKIIKDKVNAVVDKQNQFYHLIISCGSDECSEAKLNDLLSLNIIMNHSAKYFKTACIQYECKSNEDLKLEMAKVLLSCQKGISNSQILDQNQNMFTEKSISEKSISSYIDDDRSKYVRSKSQNIVKKINYIFKWFNELDQKKDDQSIQNNLLATPQFTTSEKSRRFVVVSLCISDQLVEYNDQHQETYGKINTLLGALANCVHQTLCKDDFICINIGNSQFKFLNDFQSKMETWQSIFQKSQLLYKIHKVYQKGQLINPQINQDALNDNNQAPANSKQINNRKMQKILEFQKLSMNTFSIVFYSAILWQIKYYTKEQKQGNCLSQKYSIIPLYEEYKTSDVSKNAWDIQYWIEFSIILEIIFCSLRILTSLQIINFKSNKGIAKKFLTFSNWIQIIRLINFFCSTYLVLSIGGRACFCYSRDWFTEFCQFSSEKSDVKNQKFICSNTKNQTIYLSEINTSYCISRFNYKSIDPKSDFYRNDQTINDFPNFDIGSQIITIIAIQWFMLFIIIFYILYVFYRSNTQNIEANKQLLMD